MGQSTLTKDASELMRHVSHFNVGENKLADDHASGSLSGQSIVQQQRRATAFLTGSTNGSAARKIEPENDHDDWQDF